MKCTSQLGCNTLQRRAGETSIMSLHMHPETTEELRDLHAARFAEIAALREMLVTAGEHNHGPPDGEMTGRMREAVTEILRLQRSIARLGE